MATRFLTLTTLAVLAGAGCAGVIGGGAPDGQRPGGPGTDGSGAGAIAGGAGTDGARPSPPEAAITDPEAQPPRFTCDAEAAAEATALRRLTRSELLHSIEALVGADVMASDPVTRAAARIPLEPPGDLVATFQNGHAADHVEGILLTAQAVAAEVAADDAVRVRVLGVCADAANRACAEAFLDGAGTRILRRPVDPTRREALLSAFDAEGGGLAGMQWLLSRLLQSPETVFHVELPRQRCDATAPAETLRLAWDDASVFFAPLGAAETGPQQTLTEAGWYVWQIPPERVGGDYTGLAIELSVQSDDGVPLELDVNLDDMPLLHGQSLDAGEHTLSASVEIAAGEPTKVGVYFKNPAGGRALSLAAVTLSSDRGGMACTPVAAEAGAMPLDDWSIASRVAFALTGEGPDALLLEAAAAGELGSVEGVMPHAERLIETPQARRQLEAILDAWLGLHAIPTPHPTIAGLAGIDAVGLPEEARRELLDYALHLVFDLQAGAAALMSEPVGFPRSERMATLYGAEQAQGETPSALSEGHGGLLLRIAPLLSGQLGSSPILRGVYVRKRILCDELPSPDFSIVSTRLEQFEAEDRTAMSTREAVTEITSEGACNACHSQINPLGFALEPFGPLGQPRAEEIVFDADGEEIARHPIDSVVENANLEAGAPGVLTGPEDLSAALANSAKVRACIAERFYTHAQLRPLSDADGCAVSAVEMALREGESIKTAWLRAVVHEALLSRRVEEVTP
ncbi:MAG: DUF1588 domain-containing protein [Myxococcales bacterium]|nr:DUF1588 domain-containing protein [Myxococcales bacterium]